MQLTRSRYAPGILLFIIAVIIGLFSYKDYGISWDEIAQRNMGWVNYNYIVHNDPQLNTFIDRDHGVAFELPLIMIEKILNLTDSRDVYFMRHFVTHLFFLIGGLFGYILAYRLFKNNLIACLCFIMLVFHPRLYAHSFFNTKDIPLLTMFTISFTVCQVAFEKNKTILYLLLGIACGYTTGIRVLGILLVLMIFLFFIADIITAIVRKERAWPAIINCLCFITAFCGALYISFPTLWHNPVTNFVNVFQVLSHFRWDFSVLFNGLVYKSSDLPWYYLSTWFSITTPLLWLVAGVAGIVCTAIVFFKTPLVFITNTRQRNFTLYIACFFLPLVAIIALHSLVYDDWRHVYFIYPAFVLLACYGIHRVYTGKKKTLTVALFAAQIAGLSWFMFSSHPFQQVYFNRLASSHKAEYLREQYELDYWGNSVIKGLEYLLAHDTAAVIKIMDYPPVEYNTLLLPEPQRKRITTIREQDADYIITNFRSHPEGYNYPYVYNIKVLNNSILRIYKLH